MDGLLPLGPVAMNLLVDLTWEGMACAPLPSAVCSTGGGSLSSGCWYTTAAVAGVRAQRACAGKRERARRCRSAGEDYFTHAFPPAYKGAVQCRGTALGSLPFHGRANPSGWGFRVFQLQKLVR